MAEIENNVYELTRNFAIRIVKLYSYLLEKKEYVMSKQLLKSGTSIGANVFEAKNAQSRPDFISKMSIALKEASESGFWLDILHETKYLKDKEFDSLFSDWRQIYATLVKIVKTSKENAAQTGQYK